MSEFTQTHDFACMSHWIYQLRVNINLCCILKNGVLACLLATLSDTLLIASSENRECVDTLSTSAHRTIEISSLWQQRPPYNGPTHNKLYVGVCVYLCKPRTHVELLYKINNSHNSETGRDRCC